MKTKTEVFYSPRAASELVGLTEARIAVVEEKSFVKSCLGDRLREFLNRAVFEDEGGKNTADCFLVSYRDRGFRHEDRIRSDILQIEDRPGIALAVNADDGVFLARGKGRIDRIVIRGRGIVHTDPLREDRLVWVAQIFLVVGKVDLIAD